LNYLFGVGGVLLFQAGFTYAIMVATRGGGSFVGLWAMLLAVLGIPLTVLLNVLLVRAKHRKPESPFVLRWLFVSLGLPALQAAVLILAAVLRL